MTQTITNPLAGSAARRGPAAGQGPSGFLAVRKPSGITSFDVIRELRRITRVKKLGHSGVLDRPAEGVLVVGYNKATRLFEFFSGMEKEYIGDFWLGLSTTTDDTTGELTAAAEGGAAVSAEQFTAALARYRGEFDQLPPAFSLTKKDGKEMYRYALAGEEVEVEPKRVCVLDSRVLSFSPGARLADVLPAETRLSEENLAALPQLCCAQVELRCTGGLYVRSMARDIGRDLGLPGTLGRLLRTRVGPFRLDQCLSLEQIARHMESGAALSELLLPLSSIAPEDSRVPLDSTQLSYVKAGRPIRRFRQQMPPGPSERGDIAWAIDGRGELAAVLQISGTNPQGLTELRPLKVIA